MNIITECQDALDRYAAHIGISESIPGNPMSQGTPGTGSRAERARQIPDEEWESGRQIRRTREINNLLATLRKLARSSKTGRDDTKLGYLLREDYRGFHERWPNTGILRADDSVDSSQVRMIMANSIKGRGFTRVQFIALMSYFFGHECYQKWKNKQRVQEELATLWFKARGPRADEYKPVEVQPAPRGRAGDHSNLLEQAYEALVSFKAGTEAILTTQDLADALGIVRRTACKLLYELTKAGRITYRSARQNSGIVVSFVGGVIYSENTAGDTEHREHLNGHKPDEPITADNSTGVIYSESEATEIFAPEAANPAAAEPAITAEAQPLVYIYKCNTVSLASDTITPRNRVGIDTAVLEAFENLPKDRVLPSGELKQWNVTNKRVLGYVQEHYAERGWKPAAILDWVDRIRKRRKAKVFDNLKGLRREVIEKKAASIRKGAEHFEQKAVSAETEDVARYYKSRAGQLLGSMGLLAWEQQRRDTADDARIAVNGYTAGEQQEMLELVERERRDTDALVERLRAAKVRRQDE